MENIYLISPSAREGASSHSQQCSSLSSALQAAGGFLSSGPEVLSKDNNLAAESLFASSREGSCTPGCCVCTNDQTVGSFTGWACCWPFLNQTPVSVWRDGQRCLSQAEGLRWTIPPSQAPPGQQTAKPGCGRMGKPFPLSALINTTHHTALISFFPEQPHGEFPHGVFTIPNVFCAKQIALNKLHLLKHFWGAFFPSVI